MFHFCRQMYKFLPLLALLPVSACGANVAPVLAALQNDKASFCVHAESNYPPFASNITIVRSAEDTTQVTGTTGCSLVNGQPAITTIPSIPAVSK